MKKLFQISRISLVFFLVFAWFFLDWLQLGNFSLKIQRAEAAIAAVSATPNGVVNTSAGTTCANVATAGFGNSTTQTIVIVISTASSRNSSISVSDNATGGSNTYTKITSENSSGGYDYLFYSANIPRVNSSGLVVTASWTSNARNSCAFKAYTGVVSAQAATTSTATSTSTTTPTIATITRSPNSLIVSGFSAAIGSTTVSARTSYGTLNSSAVSGSTVTPSTGLVSLAGTIQGGTVTTGLTWGTARTSGQTALELRSDLINPVITPDGGSFNNDTSTTLTGSDSGATYCYTIDGSNPAAATPGTCSAGNTYSGAFNITATATTVKVLATKSGWTNSAIVTSNAFTLTVGAITSSPGAGTYPGTQNVSLNIATTTSAVAHYTTDGSAVTCSSSTYSVPFNVLTTTTVKAIGCKTNYLSDTAISDLYTITVPDAPTSVVATDGTYTDKVTITWTKSTGATDYHVWRDSVDLGAAGDVATFDDTGAGSPSITAGSAVASDGTSATQVNLSLNGTTANNGTTHTYKVVASNAVGNSADSATNTGYRGVGALNYQWQRSAADSDASYADISGATSAGYADTNAPADGSGRYYRCVLNATGASQQISASDRGFKGVVSITLEPGSGTIAYGVVAIARDTTSSGVNQTQVVRNNGNVAEDFDIKGQATANWILGLAAGNATYKHEWCTVNCDTSPVWNIFTTNYAGSFLASNVAANATQDFDLRITVPTSNQSVFQQTAVVYIQATQH